MTGNAIPQSAYDARSEPQRQLAIRELYNKGLRWVVLDEGAYLDEAKGILRQQLDGWIDHEERFDEGEGVRVLRLKNRQ